MNENLQILQSRIGAAEQELLLIKARYEERRKRREEIRLECRNEGFDPDNLEVELERRTNQAKESESKLEKLLLKLEKEVLKCSD